MEKLRVQIHLPLSSGGVRILSVGSASPDDTQHWFDLLRRHTRVSASFGVFCWARSAALRSQSQLCSTRIERAWGSFAAARQDFRGAAAHTGGRAAGGRLGAAARREARPPARGHLPHRGRQRSRRHPRGPHALLCAFAAPYTNLYVTRVQIVVHSCTCILIAPLDLSSPATLAAAPVATNSSKSVLILNSFTVFFVSVVLLYTRNVVLSLRLVTCIIQSYPCKDSELSLRNYNQISFVFGAQLINATIR